MGLVYKKENPSCQTVSREGKIELFLSKQNLIWIIGFEGCNGGTGKLGHERCIALSAIKKEKKKKEKSSPISK